MTQSELNAPASSDEAPNPHVDHYSSACCYAMAIICMGQAISLANAKYPHQALIFICVAIALTTTGLTGFLSSRFEPFARRALRLLIGLGIVIGICRLPLVDLFLRFPASRELLRPFVLLALVTSVMTGLSLFHRSRSLRTLCFLACLISYWFMGAAFLRLSSNPRIDVYMFQRLGCQAILQGRDPYANIYPNVYGPGQHFYPPGSVVKGIVQFGYSYPPLSLLVDLPAYFAGDIRYTHLTALVLAALLLGIVRPHRQLFAPALMSLFIPGTLFLLENAWFEPLMLLLFTLTIFLIQRRFWRSAAIALGLLLASKQYLVFLLPAIPLLTSPRFPREKIPRLIAITGATGLIVTLPFIVWNPHAFFHSLTSVYIGILREDSISVLAVIKAWTGIKLSIAVTILASLPPIFLTWKYAPRNASGFAASASLILTTVFAFGTQAFSNYFFLTAGFLCTAIALFDPAESGRLR